VSLKARRIRSRLVTAVLGADARPPLDPAATTATNQYINLAKHGPGWPGNFSWTQAPTVTRSRSHGHHESAGLGLRDCHSPRFEVRRLVSLTPRPTTTIGTYTHTLLISHNHVPSRLSPSTLTLLVTDYTTTCHSAPRTHIRTHARTHAQTQSGHCAQHSSPCRNLGPVH
jgi:hypothetical protein